MTATLAEYLQDSMHHTPFLHVPQGRHFSLFALLRNAISPMPGRAEALITEALGILW
jgi:hypothetical protein